MLARPTRRVTYHRALESGELNPQNERELRRSEWSGMLIGDPLGEGSSASSIYNELLRAESSFLRMRGNSGRLARAGGLWPERFIFMIHNLQ